MLTDIKQMKGEAEIFALSLKWSRNALGNFCNSVYILPQTPQQDTCMYNITSIIEVIEDYFGPNFMWAMWQWPCV